MGTAARAGALCGSVGAALLVWFVACTGEDPVYPAPDASTESGGPEADSSAVDASDAGASSDSAPVDAAGFDAAACPVVQEEECGTSPTAIDYGTPALHLDACAMGKAVPQHHAQTWTAKTNQVLQPLVVGGVPTGAEFCRAALNARPAMVFEKNGFTLPAAATTALDGASSQFVLVVVMRYERNGPAGEAAGIVFQRNASSAPFFPGPQLAATFAYASTPGTTSLEPTDLLGASLRFGSRDNSTDAGSISAVTTAYRGGETLIATASRDGSALSLTINGVPQHPSPDVPPGLETGNGLAVNIGGSGSNNNCLRGAIGELLYYVGDAKPGPNITAALKTKWGIP